MDKNWWNVEGPYAFKEFQGAFITDKKKTHPGVVSERHNPSGGNSGAGAISLGVYYGANPVILLGCDCKYDAKGKRHWHGDHRKGLGNAVSIPKFPAQFEEVAKALYNITIWNCSPDTALVCWPKKPLEQALWPTN